MVQPKGLGDVYRGDITIYHDGFSALQCGRLLRLFLAL